jgi:hypothetical protein
MAAPIATVAATAIVIRFFITGLHFVFPRWIACPAMDARPVARQTYWIDADQALASVNERLDYFERQINVGCGEHCPVSG